MGDPNLNGAQENLFGNYIVQRGLANPNLRDEILVQVANQVSLCLSCVSQEWETEEERVRETCAHHLRTLVRCGGIPTPSTRSAAGCSSLPAWAPSCLHRGSPNTCWSETLNDLSLSLLFKVRSIFRLHYFYSPDGASAWVLSMIQRVRRRHVALGTCTRTHTHPQLHSLFRPLSQVRVWLRARRLRLRVSAPSAPRSAGADCRAGACPHLPALSAGVDRQSQASSHCFAHPLLWWWERSWPRGLIGG